MLKKVKKAVAAILAAMACVGSMPAAPAQARVPVDPNCSTERVTITVNAFLPFDRVDNPNYFSRWKDNYRWFGGDGNYRDVGTGGSSRTSYTLTIHLRTMEVKPGSVSRYVGLSTAYDSNGRLVATARGSGSTLRHWVTSRNSNSISVLVTGDESIPFFTSPGITYQIWFYIEQNGKVHANIGHNGFPGYEVFLNGDLIHGYNPRHLGATPWNLWDIALPGWVLKKQNVCG